MNFLSSTVKHFEKPDPLNIVVNRAELTQLHVSTIQASRDKKQNWTKEEKFTALSADFVHNEYYSNSPEGPIIVL